jgi:hypothetical protein
VFIPIGRVCVDEFTMGFRPALGDAAWCAGFGDRLVSSSSMLPSIRSGRRRRDLIGHALIMAIIV